MIQKSLVWYSFVASNIKFQAEFIQKINTPISSSKPAGQEVHKDVWKAHLWQGFQISNDPKLSAGRGKWANIISSSKSKQRIILNSHRMVFDCDVFVKNKNENRQASFAIFVEKLLEKSLSFSFESLEESPNDFANFLCDCSRLKKFPLHEIDFSTKQALCIFVNLYHCLLQHALLLSLNGAPVKVSCFLETSNQYPTLLSSPNNVCAFPFDFLLYCFKKKSFGHFMRTCCYEIGGDVFSLAELQCCIIRGKMSKPVNPKPPFIEAPKKSLGHLTYSLHNADPRINFVLVSSFFFP